MTDAGDEMLERMVQAIIDEVDPQLIMLFGSRASGRPSDDSDVDLLVVEREPFGPERLRLQELRRIRRALSGFRVPKDILLYSVPEMEKWKGSLNHIISDILREGKRLYERP